MTSNDKPTYILLKDWLPTAHEKTHVVKIIKKGSELNLVDNTYKLEGWSFDRTQVECNPEWFKKKEQVIEQPIKVGRMSCTECIPYGNSDMKWNLQFKTNKHIHYDKATSLCELLEWALREKPQPVENPTTNVKEPPVKDYEVTEIICYGNEVRFLENGLYRIFHDGVGFDFDYLMANPDSKIKTVLRKSDNTVFTIGDEISWGYKGGYKTTLTGFIIHNGRLKFSYSNCPDRPCDFLDALNLHKIKKEQPNTPLFITEDGVAIFYSPNRIWQVFENWVLSSIPIDVLIDYKNQIENVKLFSTEEKAKEYILLNKPCLSLKDILHWYERYGDNTHFSKEEIIELENIINKKIITN